MPARRRRLADSRCKPIDAVLAVTYRCNARCAMCGIWKGTPGRESPPETFANLPSTLKWVNVTGGEPFLRDDLAALIGHVSKACPKAEIVVSTNGFLTERIADVVGRAGLGSRLGVAVSVDGIGEMHDTVRGVPGAFDKARATLDRLREMRAPGVRMAFTLTPENLDHFGRVYALSRELGVDFSCALAQGSEHYFQIAGEGLQPAPEALRRTLEPVARAELRGGSPKRWARAYFLAGIHRFASGEGRLLPCRAGGASFFVAPSGDVYPCNVLSRLMGNLNEQRFEEMWRSERADEARREVAGCSDGCWMVCTVRSSMWRHLPRVMRWALLRKLRRGPAL